MEGLSLVGVKNITLSITVKHRKKAGEVEAMQVVGDIVGRRCVIVDDMIDTAGTLVKSADTLIEVQRPPVISAITTKARRQVRHCRRNPSRVQRPCC